MNLSEDNDAKMSLVHRTIRNILMLVKTIETHLYVHWYWNKCVSDLYAVYPIHLRQNTLHNHFPSFAPTPPILPSKHHFPPRTPPPKKRNNNKNQKKCESSSWINNAYIDIILLSFTCARQSECRAHFTANKNVEDDDDDDDDNNETCRLNTVKMIRQISISIESSGKKVSKF